MKQRRARQESPEEKDMNAKIAALEAEQAGMPHTWTKAKQVEYEALQQRKKDMRTIMGAARS